MSAWFLYMPIRKSRALARLGANVGGAETGPWGGARQELCSPSFLTQSCEDEDLT